MDLAGGGLDSIPTTPYDGFDTSRSHVGSRSLGHVDVGPLDTDHSMGHVPRSRSLGDERLNPETMLPPIKTRMDIFGVEYIRTDHGARISSTFADGPGVNVEKRRMEEERERSGIGASMRKSRLSRMNSSKNLLKKDKPRSLSPNHRFRGKPIISKLREKYPCQVRSTAEPTDFDSKEYSGVVSVEYNGRFDVLNAVGLNVAKKDAGPDGPVLTPGRIVSQRSLKGRTTGMTYRCVYLDGTFEVLDESKVRHYANIFNVASARLEDGIKPIIVRMI